MKILEVKNINKSYGKNHVLKDVSFDMERGEVVAVIGSSGGGKSTLLRSLTFLEKVQTGSISIGGEEIVKNVLSPKAMEKARLERKKNREKLIKNISIYQSKVDEAEQKIKTSSQGDDAYVESVAGIKDAKRLSSYAEKLLGSRRKYAETFGCAVDDLDGDSDIFNEADDTVNDIYMSHYPHDKELRSKALKMGLVFQDFNLFPHKTVLQNLILAPMLVAKKGQAVATEIALAQLAKVGLSDKADAYPCNISGGQKQRVAIARALCMEPEILCFDEPTSALDPELTGEVLKVISELKHTNVTMLIVTHEIMFAREVADRVIFLDNGTVLEIGVAKDVIDNPREDRTKEFMNKILKG